jgi:hypothetical protein
VRGEAGEGRLDGTVFAVAAPLVAVPVVAGAGVALRALGGPAGLLDEAVQALRDPRRVVQPEDELGPAVPPLHEAVADTVRLEVRVDDPLELLEPVDCLELAHVEAGILGRRAPARLLPSLPRRRVVAELPPERGERLLDPRGRLAHGAVARGEPRALRGDRAGADDHVVEPLSRVVAVVVRHARPPFLA